MHQEILVDLKPVAPSREADRPRPVVISGSKNNSSIETSK